MTNQRLVRDCSKEEAESILNLWRRAEATVSSTDTMEDIRRVATAGMAILLVAEQDGHFVGSVIGGFDGWRGNIYWLAVHPEYRRQGVARRLEAEVESRLAEVGAKRITALLEEEHPWATGFWEAVDYILEPSMARYVRNL